MQYLSSGFFIISIHAPRTGSDFRGALAGIGSGISIHAPRTGSDRMQAIFHAQFEDISIHAPRTGSDLRLAESPSAS